MWTAPPEKNWGRRGGGGAYHSACTWKGSHVRGMTLKAQVAETLVCLIHLFFFVAWGPELLPFFPGSFARQSIFATLCLAYKLITDYDSL